MPNPNYISNPHLAYEMADAESPYRELALHARKLGLVAVSAEMVQRANEASDHIAQESYRNDESESSIEDTHEQLLELFRTSGVVASTWMYGDEVHKTYGGGFGSGYQTLHGENLSSEYSRAMSGIKTNGSILEKIKSRDVAEVVTFTNLENSQYYSAIPDHHGSKGSVVVMSYETTVGMGYGGKRYQQGIAQVPGIQTRYHLVMEPSQAAKLQEAIASDPQILHKLTNTLMQDVFGIKEETWEKLGPQYEAWKELNGGTHRIAVRNGMDLPAEQSEIIEFA